MRKRVFGISNLKCPVCEKIFPIPRKMKSKRAQGHIKTIWCPFCKDMRNFEELGLEKENLRF